MSTPFIEELAGPGRRVVIPKLLKGFCTYGVLELALYHSLGKLPEPESPRISSDDPFFEPRQRNLWVIDTFRWRRGARGHARL